MDQAILTDFALGARTLFEAFAAISLGENGIAV